MIDVTKYVDVHGNVPQPEDIGTWSICTRSTDEPVTLTGAFRSVLHVANLSNVFYNDPQSYELLP